MVVCNPSRGLHPKASLLERNTDDKAKGKENDCVRSSPPPSHQKW